MDSSNLRSWEGHLANTEKLSTLIGWSKLRACSLMLLKGGFEKGMLVLGDIPLCCDYKIPVPQRKIYTPSDRTKIYYPNVIHKWSNIFT